MSPVMLGFLLLACASLCATFALASTAGPRLSRERLTGVDVNLGMSRRDAYQSLADRTTVEGLRRFAKSIIQAEEQGVPISGVVRTQAKEMRIRRRSRAEAKAQQVPVKILFPLMAFILPVLFIIVMGPPVTNAFRIN